MVGRQGNPDFDVTQQFNHSFFFGDLNYRTDISKPPAEPSGCGNFDIIFPTISHTHLQPCTTPTHAVRCGLLGAQACRVLLWCLPDAVANSGLQAHRRADSVDGAAAPAVAGQEEEQAEGEQGDPEGPQAHGARRPVFDRVRQLRHHFWALSGLFPRMSWLYTTPGVCSAWCPRSFDADWCVQSDVVSKIGASGTRSSAGATPASGASTRTTS